MSAAHLEAVAAADQRLVHDDAALPQRVGEPPAPLAADGVVGRHGNEADAPVAEFDQVPGSLIPAPEIVQHGAVAAGARRHAIDEDERRSRVDELFELRVALEGMAAELAAMRMTPEELVHLESLQPPRAADPTVGDMRKFLAYNGEFHAAVARGSRNTRLVKLIQQVNEEMSRMIAASYEIGEHKTVLAALRSGNPAAARAAMVEHISASQTRALKRDVVDFVRRPRATRPTPR